MSRWTPEDVETYRFYHRVAGTTILIGAGLRMLAWILPWITLSAFGRSTGISALRIGTPRLSIVVAIVALVLAIGYTGGSRRVSPWVFAVFGGLAFGVTLWDFHRLLQLIDEGRQFMAVNDSGVHISPSIGPWVALLAALLVLGGAIWGVVLSQRGPSAAEMTQEEPRNAWLLGLAVGCLLVFVMIVATNSPHGV